MASGIVQLHLTRHCNLQCAHCYSMSGPARREQLPLEDVLVFLDRARAAGYSRLSLSGGEPFLYPRLVELLHGARGMGWAVSAVTNGTLLDKSASQEALALLDFVGVSIDGTPARHAAMRQSPTAFERTRRGLEHLRRLGKPFAMVHTLTHESVDDLNWLVDFARREGADVLRLHPLEGRGAATEWRSFASPVTGAAAARAFLVALAQRAFSEKPAIEVDLLNREALRVDPSTAWPAWAGQRTLAELVDPLVVEPDGAIVPFSYGMHRKYRLGWLHENVFEQRTENLFRQLDGFVRDAIAAALDLEWPYFNWYEHLVERSWLGAALAPERRVHFDVLSIDSDVEAPGAGAASSRPRHPATPKASLVGPSAGSFLEGNWR